MDPEAWQTRTFPKCGGSAYQFRGRKRIEAEGDTPAAVETKYRCKACQHEWRERMPA
jgi:hypothetical protein